MKHRQIYWKAIYRKINNPKSLILIILKTKARHKKFRNKNKRKYKYYNNDIN